MYNQFTYGKLDEFSPDKIIAFSAGLVGRESALRDIARNYTFWQPPLGVTRKQAVGAFLLESDFFGDKENFIVLVKAAIQVRPRDSRSYAQYCYVFIPTKELEEANLPNGMYELLIWFASTPIPQNTINLEKLYIPVLDLRRSSEYRDSLESHLKCIQDLLEEKDINNELYLITAISSLLNDQRVLINLTPRDLVDPLIFLMNIIRLLPAACRHELSVAIGDFDEKTCKWASFLVKLVESNSINSQLLPQGCIWLDRSEGSVLGVSQPRNPNSQQLLYLDKIKEILSQADTDWILSLLQELNNLTDSSWNLTGLKNFPEQLVTRSHEIKLGLWGVPGAGKTTYILQLYQCMSENSSGFNILAEDDISQDFIRKKQIELSTNGYTNPTPPGEEKTITYTIETLYTLTPRSITLSFIDAPGGYYSDLGIYTSSEDVMGIKVNDDKSLVQHLIDCNGIIFLLKPDIDRTNAESHQIMVPNVLQFLRRYSKETGQPLGSQGRLKQFMAFCATKVDKAEYWESRNDPNALVKSILGTAVEKLNNHCFYNEEKFDQSEHNRCKFFAIASIGRYQDENGEMLESIEYPDFDNANYSINARSAFSYDDEPEITVSKEAKAPSNVGNSNPSHELFGRKAAPKTVKSSQSSEQGLTEPILKLGINPEPFNVVEPVKWLIRKIYAHQMK